MIFFRRFRLMDIFNDVFKLRIRHRKRHWLELKYQAKRKQALLESNVPRNSLIADDNVKSRGLEFRASRCLSEVFMP